MIAKKVRFAFEREKVSSAHEREKVRSAYESKSTGIVDVVSSGDET